MGTQTIDRLRERVRGDVITPSDEGYENARKVLNAMIDVARASSWCVPAPAM